LVPGRRAFILVKRIGTNSLLGFASIGQLTNERKNRFPGNRNPQNKTGWQKPFVKDNKEVE